MRGRALALGQLCRGGHSKPADRPKLHASRGTTPNMSLRFPILKTGCLPAPADNIQSRRRARPLQTVSSMELRLRQTKRYNLCPPPTTTPCNASNESAPDLL